MSIPRGFISLGLGLGLVLLLVTGLAVFGGIGYYITQNPPASQSAQDQNVSTTTPQQGTVEGVMPSCILAAQPNTTDRILRQDTEITMSWSSENGTAAYLWPVVGMGGDIVLVTLSRGEPVALEGSVVKTISANSAVIGYALVIRNSEGAAMCHTNGTKQFRTREWLDNPPKMG